MTASTLKARITDDMKSAMRAKETLRLGTIRLLLAAIKQREVDERIELDDASVSGIIEKLIKQRRDSISQFQTAGRQDLVDAEQAELAILQAYLPEPLSPAEVDAAVTAAVAESGASSVKDMGKVMGLLKSRLAGRADMGQVSALIKAKLAG
ncbi:MAG: GatB/YqeY domain-containing protein [Thiobacillus sp.]